MPEAEPREPYRRFTDERGGDWLVWRLSEEDVAEIREAASIEQAWLVFLGPDGETRRLAPVPYDWRRMRDAQLSSLAARATPFRGR